jgi:hypothetical protein
MQVRSLAQIIYIGYSSIRPPACDQFWLLDWYPNQADSNLLTYAVGIFLTHLLRQLFGLETLRQNHNFKTLVFE